MFIGNTVRVIPSLIPSVEKQLLCATFLEAVIRFYKDPENMRSFEQWRNEKGWDTSNRAINVIINNLKGIFFDDDDFEHMSCSIDACWSKIGMTEIRICDYRDLKKGDIFR